MPSPFEPTSSISEVVARLEAIETALPANDGVAAFDHLYLQVTRCVDRRLAEGDFFTDNHFLTTLDIVFATASSKPCTSGSTTGPGSRGRGPPSPSAATIAGWRGSSSPWRG